MALNRIVDDGVIATILSLPPGVGGLACLAEARQQLSVAQSKSNTNCQRCQREAADALAQASRLTKDCLRCATPDALAQIKQALQVDTLTLVYVSAANPSLSSQFLI